MVDFLKANPYMTMDDYLWNYSIPLIRLMAIDNSRVNYLSEDEVKKNKAVIYSDDTDIKTLNNDLGLQINIEK